MTGKYSEQFRDNVVQLVRGGMRVAQVATDMGVPQPTIYAWLKTADVDDGLRPGLKSEERDGGVIAS